MSTGVQAWSETAATNATSDSSVNWAEGMAPSAVNDSARAEMASIAKWRDDINGSITTTGTSTAYAIISNEGLALTQGYLVAFVPHATNGATVTLNVDALGAKPLRSAPGVELSAGVLVQGTPYAATYYTSNSGEWILHGFYGNPYNVPIGAVMPYVGATAPNSNFVLPFGQAISRTTYSALFALTGTAFGAGDGSTTFNVPDLRGRTPFGQDNMGGTAASRITSSATFDGTTIGNTGGGQVHTLNASESAVLTYTTTSTDSGHVHTISSDANLMGFDISTGGTGPTISGSGNLERHLNLNNTASSSANITSTTTSNAGGAAHNNMPPAIIMPYILRVI